MFAGNLRHYTDADGHFSLSMWQARVDRYRSVNFSSFIDDGTVIAHFLVDEPNDPANWGNQPIPGGTVEAMAEYSKQIWPNMATVVRVDPGYLAQFNLDYQYLDAAWSQYVERKGPADAYIQRSVTDAKALGLQLVVGLNILDGGLGIVPLTATEVQEAGSALLASPYPCAFISWQYDSSYLAGPGIGDAMDALRSQAQSRATRTCRAAGSAPAPTPPPATTTTIVADDPDPSTPGESVIVSVSVAAAGSAPAGTVSVTASGGAESCVATLSNGAGSCSLALTELGDRTLTASFDGGTSYGSSSDTEPHLVRADLQSVVITWPQPQDISYGTPLGAAQLNASASSGGQAVAGTYTYQPAAGTVLNAGQAQSLQVTFTPSDPTAYQGGSATVTIDVNPVAPTLSWTVPSSIQVGQLPSGILNATASGVGGEVVAGTLTYTPAAGQMLDASPSRTLSVGFQPSGNNYTAASKNVSLAVLYPWSGFFQPVDNAGRLNTAKAGVAIQVRFGLGGNQPAPVLASGSPTVTSVSCPSWPTDAIEQTVSASSSSLRYNATSNRYVYIWKTSTDWADSCRRLTFILKDGTRHEATFRFSR
jgi:hypothetical protein